MSDEALRRIARNVGRVRVMGLGEPRPADRFPSTKPGQLATRAEPTFGTLGTEEWTVLLCLANYYNEREQQTFVGLPTITSDTGMNTGSVQRAIRWLIARGLLVERGKRRSDSGRQVNTYGLNIPGDDMTQRRVRSRDATDDATDDASRDATRDATDDASPTAPPAPMLAEQNRTEPNPGCWELERCVELDLQRDPPNTIRSSRENLESHVAGDYAPIIATERERRVGLGLPPINADDELSSAWVEYLIERRKPEASQLWRRDRDRLFPKPPCPNACDANGWLEPDPTDEQQRMRPCPICRK